MLGELLLQLGGSVQGLPGLLLRQALVHLPADACSGQIRGLTCALLCAHSHDVLHTLGLDEDGDGVQLSQLESLDGVSGHVQDAVFALHTRGR